MQRGDDPGWVNDRSLSTRPSPFAFQVRTNEPTAKLNEDRTAHGKGETGRLIVEVEDIDAHLLEASTSLLGYWGGKGTNNAGKTGIPVQPGCRVMSPMSDIHLIFFIRDAALERLVLSLKFYKI